MSDGEAFNRDLAGTHPDHASMAGPKQKNLTLGPQGDRAIDKQVAPVDARGNDQD